MKTADNYLYFLTGSNGTSQQIQFLQKQPYGDVFQTTKEGVTNEEVLDVLIHRLTALNKLAPCQENEQAILNLKQANFWLRERTRDRIARGVEGTTKE